MRLGITFFISGVMLVIFGLAMLIPGLLDFIDGSPCAETFWFSALAACFFGFLLAFCFYDRWDKLTAREMYLITTLVWIVVCCFSALPFYFAPAPSSYTDSFFEAMSGLTTTGSTVLTGLEHLPRGLLLWRVMLHWFGGLGIIVIATAILPVLRIGGMQLFSMESSDEKTKNMPKMSQIVGALMMVYVTGTVLCALSLYLADMSAFDSVYYAMTAIPTGGFAPYDDSAGHLSAAAQWILTFFMFTSGLPLLFVYFLFKGDFLKTANDLQVKTYFFIFLFSAFVMTLWYHSVYPDRDIFDGLRLVSFNVISILTTTGLTTEDFSAWGPFAAMFFFFLMPVGACSGSTTGGIKIFRFNILYLFSLRYLRNKILPHGVFVAKFAGKPLSEEVISGVLVFMATYLICLAVSSMALALLGLDFTTSLSGSAASLSNVGPGIGPIINPERTFSSLPDAAKWILSFDMLVGRLEYVAIFVLLLPLAWRREKKAATSSSF